MYNTISYSFFTLKSFDNWCFLSLNQIHMNISARSIARKPRKSRNPRTFSFSSETKYSPPTITFAHGVNPYLENLFQISKKSDLPPIPLIRNAERIRGIGGNL